MGVLQALETIKVLVRLGGKDAANDGKLDLLMFSGLRTPPFRSVRMSGRRRPTCAACSAGATLTPESLRSGTMAGYESFCGFVASVRLLRDEERVSVTRLAEALGAGRREGDVLLDVREAANFAVASLPGAVNVPAALFMRRRPPPASEAAPMEDDKKVVSTADTVTDNPAAWWLPPDMPRRADGRVFVVCRVGNDSQLVARRLVEDGWTGEVVDVVGGMRAWRDEIDATLPFF
jgi:adenylyltransferase/sulfurtransferase